MAKKNKQEPRPVMYKVPEDMSRLGAEFLAFRLALGLTLTEVATLSDLSLDQAYAIERGDTRVHLSTLSAYVHVLGVEVAVDFIPKEDQ